MLVVISDAIGEQKDDWTMNEPAQTPVITDIDKKKTKKRVNTSVYRQNNNNSKKSLIDIKHQEIGSCSPESAETYCLYCNVL